MWEKSVATSNMQKSQPAVLLRPATLQRKTIIILLPTIAVKQYLKHFTSSEKTRQML
jgi:hypothetical protein